MLTRASSAHSRDFPTQDAPSVGVGQDYHRRAARSSQHDSPEKHIRRSIMATIIHGRYRAVSPLTHACFSSDRINKKNGFAPAASADSLVRLPHPRLNTYSFCNFWDWRYRISLARNFHSRTLKYAVFPSNGFGIRILRQTIKPGFACRIALAVIPI